MMSLDKLAVIFIIIILPISIVLSAYTNVQTETLKLQMSYDQKLDSATTDAIKAYQLNSFNETTSDLASMKMEEIDAAANAFFNYVATNFNMTGYSKEQIADYVPALVFTMYDGYYIYSRFTNTLTDDDYKTKEESPTGIASTYQNGKVRQEGVKPFVSYSCRYMRNDGSDFVISYTLDNFISIQGNINVGNKLTWINDSGYVIDTNKVTVTEQGVKYRNIDIKNESALKENIAGKEYIYHKSNGVKYYYDSENKNSRGELDPKWFTMLNGTKKYVNDKFDIQTDYSATNYYKEAKEFTDRLINVYHLGNLSTASAKDNYGQSINLGPDLTIFDISGIEEKTSNFNEHRLAVIKYAIEKNLSNAIKNYNYYSPTVSADFLMPKLKETEWDKILNNMTLISFLQGLPIGGKIYNGCSVVANNKNNEVVSEESIYLALGSNYYKPTYTGFVTLMNKLGKKPVGVFNLDLERRTITNDAGIKEYYYPKEYYADYGSVVSPTENANIYAEKTDVTKDMYAYNGNIYTYMDKLASVATTKPIAQAYYTALARERYSTYKVNRTYKDISNDTIISYKVPSDAVQFECNSHRYKLFTTEATWHEAAAYCERMGGHLITLNTENEVEEYLEVFAPQKNRIWCGVVSTADEKFYTGDYYYENTKPKTIGDLYRNNDVLVAGTCIPYRYLSGAPVTQKYQFICEWD